MFVQKMSFIEEFLIHKLQINHTNFYPKSLSNKLQEENPA